MPEVRLLVPITDNEGKEHPIGEVIDVDVETAEGWRALGKVSLLTTEQANMEAAGHYTDVTGRDDVAPLGPGGATQPGPQADDDEEEDDQPRSRTRKK
jgi:hypothetical protein